VLLNHLLVVAGMTLAVVGKAFDVAGMALAKVSKPLMTPSNSWTSLRSCTTWPE